MKASSERQFKAAQPEGTQPSAPEKENRSIASANQPARDAGTPAYASAPTLLSSSVSWLTQPYTAIRVCAALLGGLILRLWMMRAFPQTGGDALIYGNIAANILLHHQFALTDGSGVVHSTLIRLPGYPLFLAACFKLFGIANYRAVAWLQIALELAACLFLADFIRQIWNPRAALNTLWLATMCPFTAVYSAAPLTESLTFDCICLALWSLQRYLHPALPQSNLKMATSHLAPEMWKNTQLALFTIAISAAALLRPDGALLAITLWPALIFANRRSTLHTPYSTLLRAAAVAILAILPFAAWTTRNADTFHIFEPLAPRYATDPGEDPHLGWQHWVKTWCLDFTCTSEIYWNVPDDAIALDDLPTWAFDSPAQHQQTAQLFAEYNRDQQISSQLDARFQALADKRAADHPILVHFLMPLGRLADMLLRPRVENLTIDLRWWQYSLHRYETRFSFAYAGLNLLLLMLGLWGFRYRPPLWPCLAAYFLMRCALLATIEAPETRYTLELFPMLFALGGITLRQLFTRRREKSAS